MVVEKINASKVKFHREEALLLMKEANKIYVAKGKKVVEINIQKAALSDDELAKLVLGRSGTLRAPAIRVGKCMLVGFHEDTYSSVFGLS